MLVSLFFQIEIMLFKIHSPLSLANTQSDKHKTTLYSAYTLVYKHFEKSISPLTFFLVSLWIENATRTIPIDRSYPELSTNFLYVQYIL